MDRAHFHSPIIPFLDKTTGLIDPVPFRINNFFSRCTACANDQLHAVGDSVEPGLTAFSINAEFNRENCDYCVHLVNSNVSLERCL